MSLYFILLIVSIAIPLALSFDKKLHFYKQWKVVLPSICIVAFVYIFCDILLTNLGVWGFNPLYHSKIVFFNLPLEEWLFFLVIPYASIFLHYSLVLYFPNLRFKKTIVSVLNVFIIISLTLIVSFHLDKIYTIYAFSLVIIAIILSKSDKTDTLHRFYISFLVILIPFFIVNAILTGTFIQKEVVWYNNAQNLGIRILTIPLEDFGYAFSLILFNLLLINNFHKVFRTKQAD